MRFTFLFLLLAGCGGTTSPDTPNGDATPSDGSASDSTGTVSDGTTLSDGSTVDTAGFDFCASLKDRAMKCDAGPVANCEQQLGCYNSIMRPEDRPGLLTCFATRDCSTSEDKCVADASLKYMSDPTVSAFVGACNDKRTACMSSFANDYCSYDIGLFTDEARAKVSACVSKPCAEVKTCFDTVFASYGCK
ncbi:MAG: hypothetical protein ACXVEE_38735 [Polyangiales bacterium]